MVLINAYSVFCVQIAARPNKDIKLPEKKRKSLKSSEEPSPETQAQHGSWVVPFKIMRFGIQSAELPWRSPFWVDLIKTWHTSAKNCFLPTALF